MLIHGYIGRRVRCTSGSSLVMTLGAGRRKETCTCQLNGLGDLMKHDEASIEPLVTDFRYDTHAITHDGPDR
jgi:hypothetical protein